MSRKNYLIFAVIMLIGFLALMVAVMVNDGKPFWFDMYIQNSVLKLRCSWLTFLCRGITNFAAPLFIVVLIVILLVVPTTQKRYGLPIAGAELTNLSLYLLAKAIVARARPDVAVMLVTETDGSFPSGHTATSFVVYGMLLFLIKRYMQNRKAALFLEMVMIFLMVTIPLTRIYLCAHWLSDIIGGWLFGICILLISTTVWKQIENKVNIDLKINDNEIRNNNKRRRKSI